MVQSHTTLDKLDMCLLAVLAATLAAYALTIVNFGAAPAEDASILMRYAQHLAQGHGIVWNIGEHPVDGATDFLFMVLVAAFTHLGLPVDGATRLVATVAHVLTVLLIYLGVRKLSGSNRWLAFTSAACLAVGPGYRYIEVCFGTPVFALAAAVAWCFAELQISRPDFWVASWGFGVSSLILGLVRPEGVIYSALMLGGVLYALRGRQTKKLIYPYFVMLGLFGGIYFFWRWHYFGYPLPNPFYRKGGGHLYPVNLRRSISGALHLVLTFTPVFVLGLFSSPQTRRKTITVLIPVTGFVVIWLLLNDEMNFLMRYQYAVVPLVLLTWPSILEEEWREWRLPLLSDLEGPSRAKGIALAVLLGAAPLVYNYRSYAGLRPLGDGNYDIALNLRKYHTLGFTMAVTEAGNLPLYSEWKAVDTWGLNDPWIVHRGGITGQYIDQHHPEVIMLHWCPTTAYPGWRRMVAVLVTYAKEHHYVLAAAFGYCRGDLMIYFVRPDFADSQEIVQEIRSTPYVFRDYIGVCNTVDFARGSTGSFEDALPQDLSGCCSSP